MMPNRTKEVLPFHTIRYSLIDHYLQFITGFFCGREII